MKHTLIISILFLALSVYGQKECKVLLPEISNSYDGKCKKGLAHGKGEASGIDHYVGKFKKGLPHGKGAYTWANGNTYTGKFSKGKMDGKGILTVVKENGNEVKEGYFKKGEYLGEYKYPYRVISDQGIRKVDFVETNKGVNEVRLNIYSNGRLITPGLRVRDNNNTTRENRNGTVLVNVIFPMKRVEISFNEGGFNYRLVFDIYKENSWDVNISI